MMRRVLRLLLPVAMVGSLWLVLPIAGAQTPCDVSVSSSNVLVGQSITITALNFDRGSSVSIWADGAVVYNAGSRDGTLATSHSFSTPGTHHVWATGNLGGSPCTTKRLQVQVNAPAPTTTAAPTTTTTTTTTIPDYGVQSIVSGECIVQFELGQGSHVVTPGQVIGVAGSGFEIGLPVYIWMSGFELTAVSPDAAGEFMATVMVPDWPEAIYAMEARQPKSGADWCSGAIEIRIDHEPDTEMGECWISLAQTTLGLGFPWSDIRPVYVTYGGGFVPGEVVVITVEDGYPFVAEQVALGDYWFVEPDGSFVAFDAPPSQWIPDLGTVEVWARSNSCIAKATLGEPGPGRAEPPSFIVTPEMLNGAGIFVFPDSVPSPDGGPPGPGKMIMRRGPPGIPEPGMPPPQGVPPAVWDDFESSVSFGTTGSHDHSFFLWGEDFVAGEDATVSIEGHLSSVLEYPGPALLPSFTINEDGTSGLFKLYYDDYLVYGSTPGTWFGNTFCQAPCDISVSVQTPSCTANFDYTDQLFDPFDVPVADTIPIPGIPGGSEVINPSDGLFPEDLSPAGIAVLALVGLGFGIGGFFGGGALVGRLNGGLHPPEPGHSQQPPSNDQMPGGPA